MLRKPVVSAEQLGALEAGTRSLQQQLMVMHERVVAAEAVDRTTSLGRDVDQRSYDGQGGEHPDNSARDDGAASSSTALRRQGGEAVRERTKSRPPAPIGRTPPKLPAGLVSDSVDGAVAMLGASADIVLVIDGYNVSQRAWPEASLADQRERLARSLHQVHLRFGCDIVCCFDGDGTEGVKPLRRAGLRVVFSAVDQEADELVVETVGSLPKRIPVIVASSDGWVRMHAAEEGASVIGAPTLLAVGQRAGRR